MSFSYWGADKITVQAPGAKARGKAAAKNAIAARRGPAPVAYVRILLPFHIHLTSVAYSRQSLPSSPPQTPSLAHGCDLPSQVTLRIGLRVVHEAQRQAMPRPCAKRPRTPLTSHPYGAVWAPRAVVMQPLLLPRPSPPLSIEGCRSSLRRRHQNPRRRNYSRQPRLRQVN